MQTKTIKLVILMDLLFKGGCMIEWAATLQAFFSLGLLRSLHPFFSFLTYACKKKVSKTTARPWKRTITLACKLTV